MKVSYNWLREYAPVEASPEQLADVLTMGGLEVEGVDRVGSSLEGVVVGRVLEVRPHPDADRLTLCDVDLGDGEPIQIACGAPNVAAGQLVPVATAGTTLLLPSRDEPEERTPVTIETAEIRGEISEGMICSEDELGLSEEGGGIMVLRDDVDVGRPLAHYLAEAGFEPADAVLDVSITPNRPDAASHIGVARDAAALTGTPLTLPQPRLPRQGGEAARRITVDIEAPEACPRYVAMIVRGVTVKESPAWLKARLTRIGLRPRNNVVDVTNYVLHEGGQPLHAFDLDELQGSRIRVHLTERETTFATLDGKERTLPEGTLMIADGGRDVAIAGVMGGENSEVTGATKDVLIESAFFDPSTIRRAAKAIGVQTDASYRFERGVDADGQVCAAARAAALIAELGDGTVVPGMVDARPVPLERTEIEVRSGRIDGLLGVHVPVRRAAALLRSIGFAVEEDHGADAPVLRCTVPTFRPDVEREVDVIEEVVRLFGYDNIPEPARSTVPSTAPRELPEDAMRRTARAFLSSTGYREVYTNSMQRTETAERFNRAVLTGASVRGKVVETLNPISREMAALRPSLLPGVLQVTSYNRKHGQRLLRFFEFGHVFHRSNRSDTIVEGYAEHESFILTASGIAASAGWDARERSIDVFDVKGVVTSLLESLRVPDVRMEPAYQATDLTRHHLEVTSGVTRLGLVARLADDVAGRFDLEEPVYFAELDWATVVALGAPHLDRTYRTVSRYPAVHRDIAVIVDRSREAGPLMRTIRRAGGELLQQVDLFDLYEGERIDPGRKSLAFALRFAADRTLTDDEVDDRVGAIVEALEQDHGAALRE